MTPSAYQNIVQKERNSDSGLGPSALLDIEQSIMGKKWVATPTDTRLAEGISQAFNLPEIVGRLLVSRGVGFDQVADFLSPSIKKQLPDPSCLADMDRAADRIADAVIKGEKITVFGDYDVDGATSTALLLRFFKSVGVTAQSYIPDRLAEGYGPNAPALLKLRADGTDLLITVDCGVTAFDAIAAGTDAGLDIVILDHHRAEAELPKAHAVVNANRLDDSSKLGHMAACGTVFLTIIAVNRALRARHFYQSRPEPQIMQWLDLVALGTICDIVPLTGINRVFVAQGLKIMAMRQNAGLVALADMNSITEQPNVFHAGFVFGPRVNAGGRVGESGLGARLLSTDDPLEAKALARQLHDYNTERKNLEEAILDEAVARAELLADQYFSLLVDGEGWHPGVIGIVAARLKEKFNRPVSVVSFDDKGIGKASCRSVPQIDLGAAVIAAKQKGLLLAGGGHKMAAGFTVAREQLEALRIYLDSHAKEQIKDTVFTPELRVDSVLSGHALTLDLVTKINMLGPYGAGHAEPRFALSHVRVIKPKVVGEKHVSCFLQDNAGGAAIKAIAFRAMDSGLGEALLTAGMKMLHVAGHASLNTWMGKTSVNFQIVDAAYAL